MSHTPEPWEFRKAGKVTFRGKDGKDRTEDYPPHVVSVRRDDQGRKYTAFVAVCSSTTLPNEENGRLIAAAPHLLAAAKAKLFDCRENGECSSLLPGEYCSDECVVLAAAVAKAEGPS